MRSWEGIHRDNCNHFSFDPVIVDWLATMLLIVDYVITYYPSLMYILTSYQVFVISNLGFCYSNSGTLAFASYRNKTWGGGLVCRNLLLITIFQFFWRFNSCDEASNTVHASIVHKWPLRVRSVTYYTMQYSCYVYDSCSWDKLSSCLALPCVSCHCLQLFFCSSVVVFLVI